MELKPGVQIGTRYRIERVVVDKADGSLVVAREAQNGLLVAVKVFPPTVAESKVISRFRRAQNIENRHVPRLFDLGGLDDGRTFVAMEFLHGKSLVERVARGPLAVGDAIVTVRQACLAVAAAHNAGVVHRNLSTAKLFEAKSDSGRAEIRVLGFATPSEDSSPDSVDYLAPEQLEAISKGERSADIWALGVILYELLTGRLPFAAMTRGAAMKRVAREDPKPPRSLQPDLPWQLEQLILRCLDKTPTARIPSAETLFEELEPFGTLHEGTASRSPSTLPPTTPSILPTTPPMVMLKTPTDLPNVAKLNHLLAGDTTPSSDRSPGFHRLQGDGQIVKMKVDEVVDLARAKRIEGEAKRLGEDARLRQGTSSLPPKGASVPPKGASLPPKGTSLPPNGASHPPRVETSAWSASRTTSQLVAILIAAAVVLGLASGLIVRALLD